MISKSVLVVCVSAIVGLAMVSVVEPKCSKTGIFTECQEWTTCRTGYTHSCSPDFPKIDRKDPQAGQVEKTKVRCCGDGIIKAF